MTMQTLCLAPFPYFGGKRKIVPDVWDRLGAPKQYIEPFCGSAAMLLGKPDGPAGLEVICDKNGFIANFWRAVKQQPRAVAEWADYPVSHIDLGARHGWLTERRPYLAEALHDPDWPGCAKTAGWWLWGQCAWIGSGWCDWEKKSDAGRGVQAPGKVQHISDAGVGVQALGKVQHISDAGVGVQALGRIPHISDAGRGVQALGKVPHVSNAGRGVQALGKVPHVSDAEMELLLTSSGRTAWRWLHELAERLERVKIVHGEWSRCLNHHYGKDSTAVFLDPPYRAYESVYASAPIADGVAAWAKDNAHLRIALCGHAGDYNLPGWDAVPWSRGKLTYGGGKTKDAECVWYSPPCLAPKPKSHTMPLPPLATLEKCL